MAMLRRGLAGEPVRILQQHLGVEADGIFGQGTDAALRAYQQSVGISVDGIAGPDTFMSMGLYELVLLHRPIKGDLVKRVQEALGIGADGVFGPGTEAAVKSFQEQNGLNPDGVVDPKMLSLLGFAEFTQDKVDASLITEETPIIQQDDIQKVDEDQPDPPLPDPSFIDRVGAAVHTVEDKAAHVGTSIWGTVKSIFG
jgi:peptidoglycan hydrolase-like protein with peptidoglycan-binding domain